MTFSPGDVVQGHFSDGEWYLATVVEVNGDDTYTVSWFDGDSSNRRKEAAELKLMEFDIDSQTYHEVGLRDTTACEPVPQEQAQLTLGEQVQLTPEELAQLTPEELAQLVELIKGGLPETAECEPVPHEQAQLTPQEQARLASEQPAQLTPEERAQLTPEEQAQLMPEEQAQPTSEEQAQLASDQPAQLTPEEWAQLTPEEQAQLAELEAAQLASDQLAQLTPEERAQLTPEEQAQLAEMEAAQLAADEHIVLTAEELAKLPPEELAQLAQQIELTPEEFAQITPEEFTELVVQLRAQAEEMAQLTPEEVTAIQEQIQLDAQEQLELTPEELAQLTPEEVAALQEQAQQGQVGEEGLAEAEPREPAKIGTLTLDHGMCLYINLDRREDRKKKMEELAASHKWLSSAMTRIAAVNGEELTWPQLISDGLVTLEARIMAQRAANMNLATIASDPEECSSHLTMGGCGCALSHQKAWKALLESEAKWALILEDDLVHICQSFDEELSAVLKQLPEDFTVCYLGYHTGEPLPKGEHFEGPLVQQEDGWLAGLWCYMISRSGAEIMLEHAVPFQAQVDTVVGILAVQDGRCYTVPSGEFLAFSLPTEESGESDVQTFIVMPEAEEEVGDILEPVAEEGDGPIQLFSDLALHDAALQGLGDICMTILEKPDSGPDLNARDASGQTVLHAAAWKGLTDVCMAILERSDFTEINAIDDEGNSVLHFAGFKGLSDVCKKIFDKSDFIQAGARDCDDRTASSLAEEKGHAELAAFLREHGA